MPDRKSCKKRKRALNSSSKGSAPFSATPEVTHVYVSPPCEYLLPLEIASGNRSRDPIARRNAHGRQHGFGNVTRRSSPRCADAIRESSGDEGTHNRCGRGNGLGCPLARPALRRTPFAQV